MVMRKYNLHGRRADVMAPLNKAEQKHLEALWDSSRRAYELSRRRENCVGWIEYHDHLAGVFRGHSERHARERERYQSILAEMHTTTKGGDYAEA
jgi:hypothetical protein